MTLSSGHRPFRSLIRPPSRPVALLITFLVIGVVAYIRLQAAAQHMLPVAYAIPLVLAIWLGERTCLWTMTVAFLVLTVIDYAWIVPVDADHAGTRALFCLIVMADTTVIALVIDSVIRHRLALEHQNALLEQKTDLLTRVNKSLLTREEELDRQQRRFQTVLEMLPFGVTVANADLSDLHTNPAGEKMLRLPHGVNAGLPEWKRLWTLHHDDGREMTVAEYPLVRAIKNGEIIPAREIGIRLADGKQFTIFISAAPFRNEKGEIVGGVCAYADVTDMHNLREQLDQRRRDAEENVLRKARFLAAVSHDIRNPANAINLLAELISRAAGDPASTAEVVEMAGELKSSATALVNLVGDVLDMARFDSGKVENRPVEFVMEDLLDELFSSLAVAAQQHQLKLIRIDPPQPLKLNADRQKLARIINNLVGNAIKFTERGEVRLEYARRPSGEVVLSVHDTGVGIPAEHLHNIFDEFFQLRNPERDRTKGAGLGLSICKRLVEAMKGRIDVQSKLNEGSTFTVTLPADSAPG